MSGSGETSSSGPELVLKVKMFFNLFDYGSKFMEIKF